MYPNQKAMFDAEKQDRPGVPLAAPPIDTYFPEADADALAHLESFNKHLYRPNTYLHKWWARRCGTTFRYILKQLVTNPERRGYYESGGLEGMLVLDPLMGGGTTLHEAIRLGASVVGVDIDPIPVLQTKASLLHQSAAARAGVYMKFERSLRGLVGSFFTTHCTKCDRTSEIQYILYALRRRCSCGDVGVVDSFTIREDPSVPLRLCGLCHSVYYGDIHDCVRQPPPIHIVERKHSICPTCGTKFKDILDVPYWQRYYPLVIAATCPQHGSFYKSFDENDHLLLDQATQRFRSTTNLRPSEFIVPDGPKSRDLLSRGVHSYLDLFTPRQLLLIEQMIQLVQSSPKDHHLWLALLVSTSLEFNSLLCGYKGAISPRPGAIRHVFSHHAYSFPYTALESNPLFSGASSGTLPRLFQDRVVRAGKWAEAPLERRIDGESVHIVAVKGEVDWGIEVNSIAALKEPGHFCLIQDDFRNVAIPAGFVDYVVTDPPYYDSVQYSDLSSFFRVWLSHLLPDTADWAYDPSLSAVASDMSRAGAYGQALTAIWQKCRYALRRPHGRLIFTFHHWSPAAWGELTLSLKLAGFALQNRYTISSENPISVHIRSLRALKHDCILVLRPNDDPIQRVVSPRWPEIATVDFRNSRTFCDDCGAALGFFLQSDLSEEDIIHRWHILLGGNGNGNGKSKTPR
ncbi:MAG: hypothetical protein PHO26_09890 [Dehalococcoidia bacterium]|nr:hypothetical protein [Dehalococcoidia bacterium]MDD5494169.1 hypothetical protein [Dehalococcoidia bacterium]